MNFELPKRKYDGPGLQYEKDPTVTCRGDARLGTACGHCSKCLQYSNAQNLPPVNGPTQHAEDLDLERRALKACGYRVHEKERNGTRWLMAAKGLQVQYKHWHPLTSIHQAMQLLIDAPQLMLLDIDRNDVFVSDAQDKAFVGAAFSTGQSAQGLINAQCRAIVSACASLEPVR